MLHYDLAAPMFTSQPTAGRRIHRFGLFEADLRAGELRKNGVRVRLQEQPFQVLALLLDCAGEVVTRDELREKLWPADTFVDFDHSLNTAINKIREALGDSASNPRFVETLARRGYRFIAPVHSSDQPPVAQVSEGAGAANHGSAPQKTANAVSVPFHPELEVPLPHRAVTRSLFALIQVMYLSFYLIALIRLREVDRIADSFLPGWGAFAIVVAVMITAGVGIPLRCYLISGVAFDYRRLGEKFQQLFLLLLPLDQLWATVPFLLVKNIGIGAAFAVTAALLYLPFSERTLIRLAYPGQRPKI